MVIKIKLKIKTIIIMLRKPGEGVKLRIDSGHEGYLEGHKDENEIKYM
jgi:hypothetical protein